MPTENKKVSLFDIYNASGKIVRGSHPTKQHILDVDIRFVNSNLIPLILG
jgi:hypothetical protein